MSDAKSICNLGLGKIAANRVNSLVPPRTPIERHCAEGYPHWKRSEIGKRRWTCALKYAQLTQSGVNPVTTPKDGRAYRYALPNDCIRVIREKHSEWEKRGKFLYSRFDKLTIAYLADIPEVDMDPTLVEVIAARVALESVEYATQSNTKMGTIQPLYREAVNEAAATNAFELEHGEFATDDVNDAWVTSRWDGGEYA